MFELTRKVLSGTVLAAITGGVLLWGLSPGMTLKREYESYNGKPAGSEHTLQAITVPLPKRQIQVCITVHLTSTGMFIPMMRRRECQC